MTSIELSFVEKVLLKRIHRINTGANRPAEWNEVVVLPGNSAGQLCWKLMAAGLVSKHIPEDYASFSITDQGIQALEAAQIAASQLPEMTVSLRRALRTIYTANWAAGRPAKLADIEAIAYSYDKPGRMLLDLCQLGYIEDVKPAIIPDEPWYTITDAGIQEL